MPFKTYFYRASLLFRRADFLDPARGWLALLTLASLALAALVVWNIWTFDTVARGGTLGSGTVSKSPVFSQSSLDQVHAIFEARAAEEAKYQSGAYHYDDPSQ